MEPDEQSSIKKRVFWTLGAIGLLGVTCYLVGTSSWFAKQFVLPRVAASQGFTATADRIAVSAFNGVEIFGLKAFRPEDRFDVSVEDLRIEARLWNLMGESPVAKAVRVSGIVIGATIEQPEEDAPSGQRPSGSSASSPGRSLTIENLDVEDATGTLTFVQNGVTNRVISAEGLSTSITDLRPGGEAKIEIGGNASLTTMGDVKNGSVAFHIDQSLGVQLSNNLLPISGNLEGSFSTSSADGFFADLASIRIGTIARIEQDRIRQARLSFSRDDVDLGTLTVDGPVDLAKKEARLRIETSPIAEAAIDLFTRPLGLETITDGMTLKGSVELARGGNYITFNQKIDATNLGFRSDDGDIAPFNLASEILLNYNRMEESVLIRTFNTSIAQDGRPVISTSIDRPMNIAFGKGRPGFKEATFSSSVDGLELDRWSLLTGQGAASGRLTAKMDLTVDQDGAQITARTDGTVEGISNVSQLPELRDGLLRFNARSRIEELRSFAIDQMDFALSDELGEIVTGDAGGQLDFQFNNFSVRVAARTQLAQASKVLNLPGVRFSNGSATISQLLKSEGDKSQLNGSVFVSGAVGILFGRSLDDHRINIHNQIETSSDTVRLRQIGFEFGQGTGNGGKLNLEATLTPDLRTGSARIRTIGLSEIALSPFTTSEPMLSPIDRFAISGDTTLQLIDGRIGGIRSDSQINNLTLKDGSSLNLSLLLDAQISEQLVRLNEVATIWQNTKDEPMNTSRLVLTGNIPEHFSTNAASLKLQGGTCDFSHPVAMALAYLEQLGKNMSSRSTGTPASPISDDEAQKRRGYVDRGTLKVRIDTANYGSLTSTNLTARLDYDSGRLSLGPTDLAVNGKSATVSGQVSLDRPGEFQIRFESEELPLAPLVSTFTTASPQPADAGLNLSVDLVSKGGAVSGRRPISGTVQASFQGADYEVADPKYASLVDPIMTLLKIPALHASSVSDGELSLSIDDGIGSLRTITFGNELFKGSANGTINVTPDWRSSVLNLPLDLSLSKQVAERISMRSSAADDFVALPRFASVVGTIGNPHTRIDNKAGLLRLGVEVFQDEIPEKYRDEVRAVQDVLKILDPSSGTSDSEFNPLDLFRKVLPR